MTNNCAPPATPSGEVTSRTAAARVSMLGGDSSARKLGPPVRITAPATPTGLGLPKRIPVPGKSMLCMLLHGPDASFADMQGCMHAGSGTAKAAQVGRQEKGTLLAMHVSCLHTCTLTELS